MRPKDIDQHHEGGLRQKGERAEGERRKRCLLNDNDFVLSNLELSMTFP